MKALGLAACALGCAGLWGWALAWPKHAPALPAKLVGEFQRFEPKGEVPEPTPFDVGHEQWFRFDDRGSYLVRFLVAGGYEMVRWQGSVVQQGGTLVLHQVSVNGVEEAADELRFRYEWRADPEGEFLVLVADPGGYHVFLRPQ